MLEFSEDLRAQVDDDAAVQEADRYQSEDIRDDRAEQGCDEDAGAEPDEDGLVGRVGRDEERQGRRGNCPVGAVADEVDADAREGDDRDGQEDHDQL